MVMWIWRKFSTVHPRACGEHTSTAVLTAVRPGSSPRLRGTLPVRQAYSAHSRFIPAPAGNIPCKPWPNAPRPVHPRACGEHLAGNYGPNTRPGSSPRLRGTSRKGHIFGVSHRFIPAPAGNIVVRGNLEATTSVHPRACGEHLRCISSNSALTGSSPRLRGTYSALIVEAYRERFIPAPAGNMWR